MNNRKNTEDILDALNASEKVMPSESFIERMEKVAIAYSKKVSSFSKQTMIGIAASFLLLIIGNIYIVSSDNVSDVIDTEEATTDNYTLVPTKSLYDE